MKQYSVTQVLGAFSDFSAIPPEVLEAAALRGTEVHNACACFAQCLPVLGLNGDRVGYFESFKNWFDRYVDQVFMVEKKIRHYIYHYNGKIDLGCRLIDGREVIVDYKTPAAEGPTWKGQLSAYLELARVGTSFGYNGGCMSLLLRKNGKAAKAIVYQDSPADFAAFLSALNAFRYFKG